MKRVGRDITWNDVQEAHQDDLKRIYRKSPRELEQSIRRHLDGASPEERRQAYETLYGKRER